MEIAGLKLEIFIPESHLPALRSALKSVGAGRLGHYDCCITYSKVTGSWLPLHGSRPYLGSENEVCEADEIKVEVNICCDDLDKTLDAIYAVHPYEEPLVNAMPILPVQRKSEKRGDMP